MILVKIATNETARVSNTGMKWVTGFVQSVVSYVGHPKMSVGNVVRVEMIQSTNLKYRLHAHSNHQSELR